MECKFIKQGIRINEDGTIVPCCDYYGKSISVFDSDFDIDQYFKNQNLEKLNNQFDQNVWPKECYYCQNVEKHNNASLRQRGNMTIKDKIFLDVVLGNECNSDCIMCYSGQSSKIASRLRQHPVTFTVPEQDRPWITDVSKVNWIEKYQFWDWINTNFSRFEAVKFLGGEPFLHKGFWNWLASEQVIANKKDVSMHVITNGSIIQNAQLLEDWKSLNIAVSIDAINDHYNWIRNGLNWDTIESNVYRLSALKNVTISINVTLGVYNITNISKIVDWIFKNNFLLYVMPVTLPTLLTLDKTPISILETAKNDIKLIKSTTIQNQIAIAGLLKIIQTAIDNNNCNDAQRKEMMAYFNKHRQGTLDWKTLQVINGQ